jgi:glucose-6-phosphate isomerase
MGRGAGRAALDARAGAITREGRAPGPHPGEPPVVGSPLMSRASELTFDASGLVSAGVADEDLTRLGPAAAAAVETTLERRARGDIGFLDLPDDRAMARSVMDFARDLDPAIDTMVVLGIGGSSLGPRALYSALGQPFDPLRPRAAGMPRRLFFPDNVDPVTFQAIVELLHPERTLWNVVTKSGGTAETAAQMLVVVDHLEKVLGKERAKRHIVATTDPAKGALRRTADARGWATFPIAASIGGRFSVLSPVGLLPAAVAGLDVSGLLEGARHMRDRVVGSTKLLENPALLLAALLQQHHLVHGRPMTVVMSYVDALYDSADWFRQLWAESLGKANSIDGRKVNVGPTPIAARGATDQHSQLQLYAEGPDDKAYLFLGARERGVEIKIPGGELAQSQPDYAYLAGRGMGELLDAELEGTISSLRKAGRPVGRLTLGRVDAHAVGELLLLLEAATAFAGPLYGVDPYDQPGVEDAKRRAFGALGRAGFEEIGAELRAAPAPDPRYVL